MSKHREYLLRTLNGRGDTKVVGRFPTREAAAAAAAAARLRLFDLIPVRTETTPAVPGPGHMRRKAPASERMTGRRTR